MRILLFGATGQVGFEVRRALQPLGAVVAIGRAEADFATPESLRAHFAVRPDVVVNAVAWTAVDAAESAIDEATRVNVDAVRVLADACAKAGALFVHYSTDYVFDGAREAPYREDDATNPLSVYGRTKRDGEVAIADSGCEHLILRTSWVFASRGKNFVRTVLRLAKERETLRMVADQHGAPTSARLIAETTAQVLRVALDERATGRFAPGVFHLAAAGRTTWYDFARAIVDGARDAGETLRVQSIDPIATTDYPMPATRPMHSSLDTSRLCERFGVVMPEWREGLALVLEELLARG